MYEHLHTLRLCSRRLLHHLLPKAVDLDIENCMFVLLSQMLEQLDLQHDFMNEHLAPIRTCAEQRAEVCLPQSTQSNIRISTHAGRGSEGYAWKLASRWTLLESLAT